MKIVETKIYLRFISWFIIVALFPLLSLFLAVYLYNPDLLLSAFAIVRDTILFAIFISLSLVLLLSLLATKILSQSITKPIQSSVLELSKVVDDLFKTIQNLSAISQNNGTLSQFLIDSSQSQKKGLKIGSKAVNDIANSINQVAQKTKSTANKTNNIGKLASDSGIKSKEALDSLVVVKELLTENQKLSQALFHYANDVKNVASRVATLAQTSKFISLNVSIEASKRSFGEDFSDLVAQIRELNMISEQAAEAIGTLASNMQRQIEQASDSSKHQWKETDKTINIVSQTINFLNKIASSMIDISKSVQAIDRETQDTKQDSQDISTMIKKIDSEAKSLVGHVDTITQTINQQLVITRSLNRSSAALSAVTRTLNDLVDKE